MATTSNNSIARAIHLASRDVGHGEEHYFHKRILDFLIRRRLISRSPAILQELQKIIDKQNGLLRAKVSTAATLATVAKHELKQMLMKRYRANEVVINDIVDEKLLGGLKIEVDDEVIDFSIKNRIKKLQEHLIRNHE